jgi:hypothetical protein
MATLVNIRIHTQSKAVPSNEDITIVGVDMVSNAIVAIGNDGVQYNLGIISAENIVVDTPPIAEKCGDSTTNANIFATLIKGVDGVTPDMSDYYDKGEVDDKLAKKQDTISDHEERIDKLEQQTHSIMVMSEDEYNSLSPKDENTLYFIYEE